MKSITPKNPRGALAWLVAGAAIRMASAQMSRVSGSRERRFTSVTVTKANPKSCCFPGKGGPALSSPDRVRSRCATRSAVRAVGRRPAGKWPLRFAIAAPTVRACTSSGPALLAHTRLAIMDLAGGDQPLFSEDRGCAVVVNGEIYNHLELRQELEALGHRFATRSDSRGDRPRLRGVGHRLPLAPERHVRLRAVGRASAAARGGARPVRGQAALLAPQRAPARRWPPRWAR